MNAHVHMCIRSICLPIIILCCCHTANIPVIVKHPDSTAVNVFKTVTFSCTARGYDIINITWRKVGSSTLPITATNMTKKSLNEVTSILIITLAAGYYSGKYYCMATNKFGLAISNNATLLVQGT